MWLVREVVRTTWAALVQETPLLFGLDSLSCLRKTKIRPDANLKYLMSDKALRCKPRTTNDADILSERRDLLWKPP